MGALLPFIMILIGLDDIVILVLHVSQPTEGIVVVIGCAVVNVTLTGHADQWGIRVRGHLRALRIKPQFVDITATINANRRGTRQGMFEISPSVDQFAGSNFRGV